jgi:hypothetical protein
MTDQTGQRSGPAGDNCLRCGGVLTSMGVEMFRTGGTSGGWKLLFGEMAELGEDMIPFEVFACGTCRRVEMRLPQAGS